MSDCCVQMNNGSKASLHKHKQNFIVHGSVLIVVICILFSISNCDASDHEKPTVSQSSPQSSGRTSIIKDIYDHEDLDDTTTTISRSRPAIASDHSHQEMVSVNLPGDIILGGLFPVHEKGDHTPCGPTVYNRGVQRLEAMLYAVERVNRDPTILPNITIGVHILDTCSRDTYALNQSLQFVRSSLNNLDTSAFECADRSVPKLRRSTSGPVFGVIGGSYSSVSLQVANLLRLFHIPQISPASTAKALSDKTRFDLFARTVPPDNFQSAALVDIVKSLNWSYVSSIYSEGSYGEYGIEQFHKDASERNVCIAIAEKVPSTADDAHFDMIIKKLLKKPNARGVILFTRAEDARRILMAAKRANLPQPFHWIASDGWGKQQKLVEGIEDIAEGAITVELQSEYIPDFDDYMTHLTPQNNQRNPWFEEFWEDSFACKLAHNFPIVFQPGENDKVCNESSRLSDKVGYEQESKIQFVVDAVYAFAHALHKLHTDVCLNKGHTKHGKGTAKKVSSALNNRRYRNGNINNNSSRILKQTKDGTLSAVAAGQDQSLFNFPSLLAENYAKNNGALGVNYDNEGELDEQQDEATEEEPIKYVCPEMANYDGKDFYNNYLLNVSFIDIAGSEVKFDRQGDGLARYDILNYQKNGNASGYYYRVVGKWYNTSDGLELNLNDVVWNSNHNHNNGSNELPVSACSLPCNAGMIRKQQGDTCCFICDKCEDYEYVFNEYTCRECPPGHWPYPDKLSCYALPIKYIRWDTAFAIVPLCMTGLGITMTLFVISLFIKNHDTPLVRASGRELSYMLLFGILVCYCNTFALLARPTTHSCITQRFGIGVGFSIIYGALLTKTNRISRIFDSAAKSAQRPNYISPRSQVIITISFIAVQIVITMIWMIVEPPGTRHHYPDREQVILKCNIQDMSFLFSQLYNMLLIAICTVYAIKTRKIPENFNESKFIGFTMYTTCIIWLAFVPIYFSTENSYEVQITTLCVSISLSATVALVCLYSPKIYILVFHPDKNVRKLTMNSAAYRRGAGIPSGQQQQQQQPHQHIGCCPSSAAISGAGPSCGRGGVFAEDDNNPMSVCINGGATSATSITDASHSHQMPQCSENGDNESSGIAISSVVLMSAEQGNSPLNTIYLRAGSSSMAQPNRSVAKENFDDARGIEAVALL